MYWETATGLVNACCDGLEPWQIVGLTCSSTLLAVWLHSFLFQPESKYLKRVLCLWEGRGDSSSHVVGGKGQNETKLLLKRLLL